MVYTEMLSVSDHRVLLTACQLWAHLFLLHVLAFPTSICTGTVADV